MGNEARQKKEDDEMNLKKAYEDLNDARLREADANLALFEATARKSAVKSDMEEASGLRAKRDSYHAMFQEIKRGAESDLERLKAALDADWEEMERATEKFQSKVEQDDCLRPGVVERPTGCDGRADRPDGREGGSIRRQDENPLPE